MFEHPADQLVRDADGPSWTDLAHIDVSGLVDTVERLIDIEQLRHRWRLQVGETTRLRAFAAALASLDGTRLGVPEGPTRCPGFLIGTGFEHYWSTWAAMVMRCHSYQSARWQVSSVHHAAEPEVLTHACNMYEHAVNSLVDRHDGDPRILIVFDPGTRLTVSPERSQPTVDLWALTTSWTAPSTVGSFGDVIVCQTHPLVSRWAVVTALSEDLPLAATPVNDEPFSLERVCGRLSDPEVVDQIRESHRIRRETLVSSASNLSVFH